MFAAAILRGVLLPAFVAGVVLAVVRNRRAAGLALALGYPAGHVAVAGRLPLPPIEASEWLAWVGLGGGLLAALAPPPTAAAWRWLQRAVIAGVVTTLLLRPLVRNAWSPGRSFAWLAGTGAAAFALAATVDTLATRSRGARVPLALSLAAAATSGAILNAGSALVAQLAGVLASVLGAVALGTFAWRRSSHTGAVLPAVGLLCGLLAVGYHYVELPAASALLLAAAPAAPWLAETKPIRNLPRPATTAIALGLAALAAAAALLLA